MAQIKGIIRDKSTDILKVFNSELVSKPVICYYDSFTNTYCIPNYTNEWYNKSYINNLGWRFVDGLDSLYNGDSVVEVITDTDPLD